MTTHISWRTRGLDMIEEIDFEGPKLYMFCMRVEGNYFLLYIGMTRQELKSRVLDRCKLGSSIASLLGYEFLISCGGVIETDEDDALRCIDKIENLLIKEMKPDINIISGPVVYKELTSVGDIPYLHDWKMYWKSCDIESKDVFYRNRMENGKMQAREFVCEGEYFE